MTNQPVNTSGTAALDQVEVSAAKHIAETVMQDVHQVKEEIAAELADAQGTALETASSLNRLTKVLDEKAEATKALADETFLKNNGNDPDKENAPNLDEEVRDLEVRMLDKIAEAIKEKSEETKQLKHQLAAKQLNDMDGFGT